MTEPENKRIGDYVEEWRTIGDRFLHRYPYAVLLRREDDSVEDGDASFHTAFMRREAIRDFSRPTLTPAGFRPSERVNERPSDRPKLHPAGEVLMIVKREGSPFPERIGVGRARNADVCILLPKISKYHAFFTKGADEKYTLTDAGSKNGTSVEGRKLDEKVPVTLESGCEVCFGPYRFTFYTAEGFAGMVSRRAALR